MPGTVSLLELQVDGDSLHAVSSNSDAPLGSNSGSFVNEDTDSLADSNLASVVGYYSDESRFDVLRRLALRVALKLSTSSGGETRHDKRRLAERLSFAFG